MDFSLDQYGFLCDTVLNAGYATSNVAEFMEVPDRHSHVVILRHDVDRLPGNSLSMGDLEHRKGISSTYYFRKRRSVFRPEMVRSLVLLGHEIGYHYETLAKARGNCNAALALFEQELSEMREICPIRTIASHGSPLSRHDNRMQWKHAGFSRYELLGEAYLSIDYSRVGYVTDTGRSWQAGAHNLRDKILDQHSLELPAIGSTADLICLLSSRRFPKLVLQTHPERWSSSLFSRTGYLCVDKGANLLKRAISAVRRERRRLG